MKLSALLFTFLSISIFANENIDPPKIWWGEQVTIESVEAKEKAWLKMQLSELESSSVSKTMKKNTKLLLNTLTILNNKGWVKLKSLYQSGDVIYKYSNPSEEHPFGYILTRNNLVVFKLKTSEN